MELKRVDHVGIAVKNLDEAVKFYESCQKAYFFHSASERRKLYK